MRKRSWIGVIVIAAMGSLSLADELLYHYEGDVLPDDPSAGWLIADPCAANCVPTVQDGHFTILWEDFEEQTVYHHRIAEPPTPPGNALGGMAL